MMMMMMMTMMMMVMMTMMMITMMAAVQVHRLEGVFTSKVSITIMILTKMKRTITMMIAMFFLKKSKV